MSLSKLAPTITDLPVDVIGLVFEYLPLSEIFLNQSLVSKVFYQAHLQHCRSSVKHLTLVGHQMVNIGGPKKKQLNIVPLPTTDHVLALFKIARSIGNSSCRVINPSTVHLKLVSGREEAAYEMIGKKFKSITHLELCKLSLKLYYKHIVKMLKDWSLEGGLSQLTDFKLFFYKSEFTHTGVRVRGFNSNKSRCLAYIFGKGLTTSVAPALRRITLKSLEHLDAALGNEFNHNQYEGIWLRKVDLSSLESIDAIGFSVCKVRGRRFAVDDIALLPPSNLQDLSIQINCSTTQIIRNAITQLRSITVSFDSFYGSSGKTYFKGTGGNLKSLKLKDVYEPMTKLVSGFIYPFVSSSKFNDNTKLENLRVDLNQRYTSQIDTNLNMRFHDFASLHLVQSNLLHSVKEMQELSVLFPNLVHLRLDGNYDAQCFEYVKTSEDDCVYCREHIIVSVGQPNGDEYLPLDIQFIDSSTAAICKDAFVCRAMAAWPQLVKVSLQIEDFYEHALKNGADLKYFFMSETIILRDAATGEIMPKAERVWTVEKVPF